MSIIQLGFYWNNSWMRQTPDILLNTSNVGNWCFLSLLAGTSLTSLAKCGGFISEVWRKNYRGVEDQLRFLTLLWSFKKCFLHGQVYPVVMTDIGYPILIQRRFITLQQHTESYLVISLKWCLPFVQTLIQVIPYTSFQLILKHYISRTGSYSVSVLNMRGKNSGVKLECHWKKRVKKWWCLYCNDLLITLAMQATLPRKLNILKSYEHTRLKHLNSLN